MRINGIVVDRPRDGRFYLLHRVPNLGTESYILSDMPGRNERHEEAFSGFLGEKHGVRWYAEEGIAIWEGDGGKWKFKRFPAQEIVESEEAEEVVNE